MEPARPEYVPDAAASRETLEDLQRRVAADATFEDDIRFDPERVGLSEPLDGGDGIEPFHQPTGTSPGSETEIGTESIATGDDQPTVAGVDQAFLEERAISAIVVLRGDRVIERTYAVSSLSMPYIPGLLSFREGRPVLDAFRRLETEPDLAVFDGSGRIHFRQAGLATHMGVTLDCPSIGVAKSLLCGRPREPVDDRPEGWRTPIEADEDVEAPPGTVLGYAYQSRQYDGARRVNPLYVSPGHRVSAETTVDLVDRLSAGYKLPEPTRLADAYANRVKDQHD